MTTPTENVVAELRRPVHSEALMQRWDNWRGMHARGFGGSATRDEFESIIEKIDEERSEAAALIESQRAELAASQARVTALEAEKAGLVKALAEVKAAILDETNGLAIQCTIFMPAKPHPHETVVDFIDQALSRSTEKNDG